MKTLLLSLRLMGEGVLFAFQSLWLNKLRSLLSVLGITIGIFCIILVFTITDSMVGNIKTSIQSLGNDVVFVQKWPWTFGPEYPWWKYMNRPQPKKEDLEKLDKKIGHMAYSAFMANLAPRTIEWNSNAAAGVSITAVSYSYKEVKKIEFQNGRYFTESESRGGRAVALIGASLATSLFGDGDPVGKTIDMKGRKLRIAGVFKKEGESMLGNSLDNQLMIPMEYAMGFANLDQDNRNPTILVKGKEGVGLDQLENELQGDMRAIRHIKPQDEPNFALNKITLLTETLQGFFTALTLAGWLIGGLSILVGGFGIANIMFVSVKERTNQIGIQKSLGAKNNFILLQFLSESVVLSLLGGFIGILLVWLLTLAFKNAMPFEVSLGLNNILTGTFVSIIIGVVFGIIPAYNGSKLDPAEAIRTGI